MNQKEQISSGEFAILAFLCGMAIKMFMLPPLLLKVSGQDSVFVMIFYLLIELINVTLLVLIAKRNPDKTYYQILQAALGRVGAKLVVTYFTLFLLLKELLIFSEIKVFFSVSVYDNVVWGVMILPLLAVCVGYGTKTLRTIGRSGQLIVPFVAVSALLLSLLLVGNIPFSNLLPFFYHGAEDFVRGIDTFPVWFGDVSLLVICLGNIRLTKGFAVKTILSRLAAILAVSLFSVIMFANYANVTDLIDYGHNVSSMTQYSLGSHDYGRFDYLIYCQWMFAVLIKVVLIFYTVTRNVSFVVGKKNNLVTSLVVAGALYVTTVFVLKNENVTYLLCSGPVKYVFLAAEFLLPLFLFVCARVRFARATPSPVLQEEGV